MDTIELRIGNYVTIDGSVLELNQKRFEYAVCKDCCLGMEPIPLTEEWLLKFGFDQIGSSISYKIGEYCIDIRELNLFHFSIVGYLTIAKIKYVHELQNLFFALTGWELSLK